MPATVSGKAILVVYSFEFSGSQVTTVNLDGFENADTVTLTESILASLETQVRSAAAAQLQTNLQAAASDDDSLPGEGTDVVFDTSA